jgi:hypothetical protein
MSVYWYKSLCNKDIVNSIDVSDTSYFFLPFCHYIGRQELHCKLLIITSRCFVATILRNSQNYIEYAYTELRHSQEHITLTAAGAPNDGGNTNVQVRKFHLGTDHEDPEGE